MSLLNELTDLENLKQPSSQGSQPAEQFTAHDKIVPDADQPREKFDETELEDLAASIKEHGIIQQIILRPVEDGKHIITAGERQWRAAGIAGLKKVPFVIREDHNDFVQMIENVQRSNLNHTETATW